MSLLLNPLASSYFKAVAGNGPVALLKRKENGKIAKHAQAVEVDGRIFVPIVLSATGEMFDPKAAWLNDACQHAASMMPSLFPYPAKFRQSLQAICYEICATRTYRRVCAVRRTVLQYRRQNR